jgi:hypothetical protein
LFGTTSAHNVFFCIVVIEIDKENERTKTTRSYMANRSEEEVLQRIQAGVQKMKPRKAKGLLRNKRKQKEQKQRVKDTSNDSVNMLENGNIITVNTAYRSSTRI